MTTNSLGNKLFHLTHPKHTGEAHKTEKKAEAPKQEVAKQPEQKKADTGRYQTSYSGGKEINRNYSKSGGQDTSDLFTPNKPTKAGNLANSAMKGLGIGFSKDGAFDARIEGKKGSASYSGMGGLATRQRAATPWVSCPPRARATSASRARRSPPTARWRRARSCCTPRPRRTSARATTTWTPTPRWTSAPRRAPTAS